MIPICGTAAEELWFHDRNGPLQVAFTSTAAGNLGAHVGTEALARRRDLERLIGVQEGTLRFLNQVHSARVVDAQHTETPRDDQDVPTGDAWISSGAHQPLAIMVADCLPVLFAASSASGEILSAAAHAGRPGLMAGVLENTIAALRSAGATEITAWVGPGACAECYEVPAEMQDELTAARPHLKSQTSWGTPALDLRAEALHVLRQQSVLAHDVFGCTIEDPRLFSHRRSQSNGEPQGRIAGIIWRADTV